jgi:hypothetical protein
MAQSTLTRNFSLACDITPGAQVWRHVCIAGTKIAGPNCLEKLLSTVTLFLSQLAGKGVK